MYSYKCECCGKDQGSTPDAKNEVIERYGVALCDKCAEQHDDAIMRVSAGTEEDK